MAFIYGMTRIGWDWLVVKHGNWSTRNKSVIKHRNWTTTIGKKTAINGSFFQQAIFDYQRMTARWWPSPGEGFFFVSLGVGYSNPKTDTEKCKTNVWNHDLCLHLPHIYLHLPTFTSHLPHIYLAFPHLSALVQALLGASHAPEVWSAFCPRLGGTGRAAWMWPSTSHALRRTMGPLGKETLGRPGRVGDWIGQLMEVSSSPWAPKFAEGFCEGNPKEKWMMTNVWGTPHFWKAPDGDGDPKKNSSIAGKSLI